MRDLYPYSNLVIVWNLTEKLRNIVSQKINIISKLETNLLIPAFF